MFQRATFPFCLSIITVLTDACLKMQTGQKKAKTWKQFRLISENACPKQGCEISRFILTLFFAKQEEKHLLLSTPHFIMKFLIFVLDKLKTCLQ